MGSGEKRNGWIALLSSEDLDTARRKGGGDISHNPSVAK